MEKTIRFEKPTGDLLLKPCPFCGCDEVVYEEYETAVGNRWRVMCMGCVASIDPGWAQTRGTVQGMWNKRVK